MLNTLKWMTDAREGGYKFQYYICDHCEELMMSCDKVEVEKALLDPKAWQAVSKTRDWNQGNYEDCPSCEGSEMAVDWRYYMHHFIENLAMGKSIEEALSAK